MDFFKAKNFQLAGGEATFFLWLKVPTPSGNDVDYAKGLLEHGIVTIPGSYFGIGGEGYVRLALVPDLATCRRALEVWNNYDFSETRTGR